MAFEAMPMPAFKWILNKKRGSHQNFILLDEFGPFEIIEIVSFRRQHSALDDDAPIRHQ